ncbi:MAG: hypothetical protein D6775_05355 [Caldilineae bacterium]|nr:MAG: hypothetical protein D6775_05355 [Caldilineae bacterium]
MWGHHDCLCAAVGPLKSQTPLPSLAVLEALERAAAENVPVALVTVTDSAQSALVGNRILVWLDRDPAGALGLGELEARVVEDARAALRRRRHALLRYPDAGLELFVEVQQRPPHLIIVGAGHIAQPLCRLAKICDFRVTVIDDRTQFANPDRFPDADRIIAADIRQTVRDMPMDQDTYVVLVTRGHSLDVECLLEIIDRPLAYIGMIGSRRRISAVFSLLTREQGIPQESLDRVHAPIGLPIGAETPAEIALCIMAEIINVYRGGQAVSLSQLR